MSDVSVASGELLTMPMRISLPLSVCLHLTVVARERINIHADCVTELPAYCLSLLTIVSSANHDLMALQSSTMFVSTCD